MEKYKYDEGNGLWYELQGDYYIPCLKLSDENQVTIGIWGQRHLNYLRENKRVLLSGLQLSGKLNSYLACSFVNDVRPKKRKSYKKHRSVLLTGGGRSPTGVSKTGRLPAPVASESAISSRGRTWGYG